MANDDDATTRTSPGQLRAEQEMAETRDETSHQQTEREAPQESGNESAPPLPPRALPPPHPASVKGLPPLPPLPGAHFAPLPVHLPPQQSPDFHRPRYPGWEKTKLVLQSVSLVAAAVIFGIGVAYGYNIIRYFPRDYYEVEAQVALSFSPVCLAFPPLCP
jgi:DNA-binding transcriptional LysR family regulator